MIINNVKLVLENEVVSGSLEVQNGEIRAFAESQSRLPEAMDGEGGWLLPGLIELHTDNLDKFFTPRPKVDWPAHSAMSSHDALMVASGITTVLDAVAIGDVRDGGDRLENLEKMINAIEETQKRGVNRAEHRLHLRCELPHHTTLPLFEKLVQREPVTLVSLMDHSPGQRQFANREKYREYYQGKYSLTDAQMQQYEEEQLALAARWSQPNRESIAALCRARKIALASHDDATHAHVAESHQLGSVIAEFPTTFEAAEASRKHGMNVLMGAPNIVRGGSHSGNVAASELAQLGLLDIARFGHIATTYAYPVKVNGRYVMDPSPIPKFDNPKMDMMPALQLFGAGREKRIYAVPPFTRVESLDFDDHPFTVQQWDEPCAICGSTHSYLDEVVLDDAGNRMFVCSDTDYCRQQSEAKNQ